MRPRRHRRAVAAGAIAGALIVATTVFTVASATHDHGAPVAAAPTKAAVRDATRPAKPPSAFCAIALDAESHIAADDESLDPASLRVTFTKLRAEEPKVLATAPGALRGAFRDLFGHANDFYGELAKYHWQYEKIPPRYFATLLSSLRSIANSTGQIEQYLETTCGAPKQFGS